jgi:hypothetical protein
MILGVIGTSLLCFLSVAPAGGQAAPERKPVMVFAKPAAPVAPPKPASR